MATLAVLRRRTRPCVPSWAHVRYGSTVKLAVDRYPRPSDASSSNGPLVILHGLYGSKQNWRTLAKRLAQGTGSDVYALDLRNHGESPATPDATTYSDYAADVDRFCQDEGLEDVTLVGHSMGGKVAMAVALTHQPSYLARLVSVDMAPAKGPVSADFAKYLDAMREVDEARVEKRGRAADILKKYESADGVVQFLLTNLKPSQPATDPQTYRIRLPIDVLQHQLNSNDVGGFPFDAGEKEWPGPTMFIKGATSKYINRKSIEPAKSFFPDHRVETLEAGHWVHAEKPNEFLKLVGDFVTRGG